MTHFYAARWGGNIYSSSDGQTWNPLGKAFLPAGSFATIAGLAVQSGIVYALIANGNYHLLGVWRLNMQEGIWRQVSGAPADLFGPDPNQQGQAWYDLAIAVDSSDPNRLYLGGSTKIAGGQWSASLYRGIVRQVNTASGPSFRMDSTYVGSGVHADIHTLVVTPGRPNQLWVGCDGGIFVSENAGGAGTFEPRNLGLSTMTLNHLGLHPAEDAVLFGGAQDNGTLRYTGDEVWLHSAAGDGGYAVINWHNPYEIIRSYTSATLERAEDGGQGYASYDDVSVPVDDTDAPLFYAPLAGTPPNFDPAHASDANVLAFGSLRPWISTTFGSSWQSIPTGISPGDKLTEPIQTLTFASAIRLYAGTNNGDIYRFDKRGATWTRTGIDGSSDPNGLPVRGPVTCITVDPADASGSSIYNAWRHRRLPACLAL